MALSTSENDPFLIGSIQPEEVELLQYDFCLSTTATTESSDDKIRSSLFVTVDREIGFFYEISPGGQTFLIRSFNLAENHSWDLQEDDDPGIISYLSFNCQLGFPLRPDEHEPARVLRSHIAMAKANPSRANVLGHLVVREAYMIDPRVAEWVVSHDAPIPSDRCSICLEDFTPAPVLTQMPPCGHYFHLTCISRWLERSASCPNCRSDLPL